MKTYTVIFAEYVAHYGSVEIEAQNDEDALAQAKAYWRSIERGEKNGISPPRTTTPASSLTLLR